MAPSTHVERISAFIPTTMRDELERSALANDRSMSAELRTALRCYLEPRGSLLSRSSSSSTVGRGASEGEPARP